MVELIHLKLMTDLDLSEGSIGEFHGFLLKTMMSAACGQERRPKKRAHWALMR